MRCTSQGAAAVRSGTYMARTRNREDVEAMFSLLKGYFMMVGDTGIE